MLCGYCNSQETLKQQGIALISAHTCAMIQSDTLDAYMYAPSRMQILFDLVCSTIVGRVYENSNIDYRNVKIGAVVPFLQRTIDEISRPHAHFLYTTVRLFMKKSFYKTCSIDFWHPLLRISCVFCKFRLFSTLRKLQSTFDSFSSIFDIVVNISHFSLSGTLNSYTCMLKAYFALSCIFFYHANFQISWIFINIFEEYVQNAVPGDVKFPPKYDPIHIFQWNRLIGTKFSM